MHSDVAASAPRRSKAQSAKRKSEWILRLTLPSLRKVR